jgi:uncharacterized protein YbjT (DUF2867 family)
VTRRSEPRTLTVAVHGPAGAQGRPVLDALARRGHRARAVSRRAVPGVPHARSDLLDVDALARAYDGVDGVLVVLPGGAPDDVALQQAGSVLAALRAAGVPRAVFNPGGAVWEERTGLPFVDARTLVAQGLADAVPVAALVGPAGGYLENLSEGHVGRRVAARGELAQPAPADAVEVRVAARDVADAVVDALEAARPAARTVVHGPEALDGVRVASALGAHLGREVRWVHVDVEEHLRGIAASFGPQYAANLRRLYGAGADVPPPAPLPAGSVELIGSTSLDAWLPTQAWSR